MRKTTKVKKSSKSKTTVAVLAVAAPLLTVTLALLGAKLILSGALKQEQMTAVVCGIAGMVALLSSLYAALRATQKKLVWGMLTAGGYTCALLLGNLLFFGEGYGAILPILTACLCGGVLGSFTAAMKRRKYA